LWAPLVCANKCYTSSSRKCHFYHCKKKLKTLLTENSVEVKGVSEVENCEEIYEAPKVYSPLPSTVEPEGHGHAHLKYVADADYDTSPA